MSRWTPEELAILRTDYPLGGLEAVKAKLPGRTRDAIHFKASRLRISRDFRSLQFVCGPLMERIKSRVSIAPNGCWEWNGSLDCSGYARVMFRGANRRVSRVAWTAHHGVEWPEGMHALHSCDNRKCVNPAHITPGTIAENMGQASERGRLSNQRKTHCPHGHAYTPDNVEQYRGRRKCRACRRAPRQKECAQ